jgi:hypothetical protein
MVNCPICGKYITHGFYAYGDIPLCENNPTHIINKSHLTNVLSFSDLTPVPEKGEQITNQFQHQHLNSKGISKFRPMVIEAEAGTKLELNEIHVIWHEDLEAQSAVVWEVQITNPYFDQGQTESSANPLRLVALQRYYATFSELWGGAHFRPISDGPTREMRHIFSDRNSKDNRTPFILSSSSGMRIYIYSTDESPRINGEGTQYNTVNGTKIYVPYEENTLDENGYYSPSKAATFREGTVLSDVKECDDVYSLNTIGSIFPEV